MDSATITAETTYILTTQWSYIWNISSFGITVDGSLLLSLAGAGSALIFSVLGAYDNGARLIKYVEASMNDFLKYYGKGKYEDILDYEAEASLMEEFLNMLTLDLIVYSIASVYHSMFIIAVGLFGSIWIILQTTLKQTANTLSLTVGFKYFLFGVMLGSVNYFAGNVSENIVDEVLMSIGFKDHSVTKDDINKTITKTVSGPEGVSTMQTQLTYNNGLVHYDYAKLLEMQNNWGYFFWLQRFI